MTGGTSIILYIVLGLGTVAVVMLFGLPMLFAATSSFHGSSHAPSPVTEVYVPENASLANSPRNFDPSTVTVTIGLNNRVRWINHDISKVSVLADNTSDPGFFAASHDGNTDKPTRESLMNNYEDFEYTFSKEGKYGYHCSIHPWMKGTVIVLQTRNPS